MEVEVLKEAVSTLQQPRGPGPLSEVRGENRGGWPRPLCPSTHRAAGRAKSQTDLATEQDTCLNQGLHCSEFTGFKLNL